MLAAAAPPYEEPYDGPGLSGARTLPVAQLSVGYSPRETKVDTSHVAVLMEVLDLLPPVIIDQRSMTVIDGVHRLEAFRQAGRTHIEAVLFTGQRPEAMVLAIKANVKHGKPLSRGERREAARCAPAHVPGAVRSMGSRGLRALAHHRGTGPTE